jgi:hypothetical protein
MYARISDELAVGNVDSLQKRTKISPIVRFNGQGKWLAESQSA